MAKRLQPRNSWERWIDSVAEQAAKVEACEQAGHKDTPTDPYRMPDGKLYEKTVCELCGRAKLIREIEER